METDEIVTAHKEHHLVLRPGISVRLLLGLVGACGFALSVAGLALVPLSTDSIYPIGLGVASACLGLFYATTEVHASPSRLWMKRFGVVIWSVPMSRAGCVEGKGADWRLIYVFDLSTQKRLGAINWWVLNPDERVRLAEFVDRSRQELGVAI